MASATSPASSMSKYVAAFSMTVLIFGAGIIIGNTLSSAKLEKIDALQQDIAVRTLGSELQYALLAENPCVDIESSVLSNELFEISSKLSFMEEDLGTHHEQVINLKRYYSLLEIRHWLLLRKAQQTCDTHYDLILYFYSNDGDCSACKQQGYVLNTLHRKYPAVSIYSFDINIKDPVLETMKKIHNVTAPPTIVVNGKVLEGLTDKAKMEKELFGDKKEVLIIQSSSS